MTRVLHTGDTHLGYRQYHEPERRRDFKRAFESVLEDAIADDVDAVVHAGDLFHDSRPGLVDLQATVAALGRLREAAIPFLAVVGNHERTRDAQWLDLLEDLELATRLDDRPTVIGDVAFYGLDFVPRSRREDLAYDFEDHDAAHAALVGHGLFEPFPHADWDTERLLSAASVDFDAVLLGDNHHADTATVADTWVTYCGSTERVSAAERDPRGYNLVRFDEEVTISRKRVRGAREFAFVDVELGPGEGEGRVRDAVVEREVDDRVVIVTVDGAGERVRPAEIEREAIEAGALLARVRDRRERAETPEEIEVQFADPDAAVDERLQELGLSQVATTVDDHVRNLELADSNVRERIETVIEERIDAQELAGFEPAPSTEPTDGDVDGPSESDVDDSMDGAQAAPTEGGVADPLEANADEPGLSSGPDRRQAETDPTVAHAENDSVGGPGEAVDAVDDPETDGEAADEDDGPESDGEAADAGDGPESDGEAADAGDTSVDDGEAADDEDGPAALSEPDDESDARDEPGTQVSMGDFA